MLSTYLSCTRMACGCLRISLRLRIFPGLTLSVWYKNCSIFTLLIFSFSCGHARFSRPCEKLCMNLGEMWYACNYHHRICSLFFWNKQTRVHFQSPGVCSLWQMSLTIGVRQKKNLLPCLMLVGVHGLVAMSVPLPL